MTTVDLYKKHKAGEVSRESFLYEVRRDAKLPWITNLTSYNDAVTILKNKGIIRETVEETPVEETQNTEEAPMDEMFFKLPSREEIKKYTDEIGKNPTKEELGVYFANHNLYEREEDALLSFYGFSRNTEDVVDVLRAKSRFERKKHEPAEELQEAKKKQPKTVDADHVNAYEYRLGLQHELETSGDYSNAGLSLAKDKVLKNLAKDVNYYTTLTNADKSPYTFKTPESQEKNADSKFRPDGRLKKELVKNVKANVKDTEGNKEKGNAHPKGVKEFTQTPKKAKGISKVMEVPGKPKVVKEGITFKDFFLNEDEKKETPQQKKINKIKAKLKKETVTAKTGDSAHDSGVVQKINKISNPSAKASLSKAFNAGQSIDI